MNKLISLTKSLSGLGFHVESGLVRSLIKSAAPPLEGFVSLDPYEPVNLNEDEEDEEGNPVERKLEKMRRKRRIERSRDGRRTFNSEAEEKSEMDAWYKSLSSMGDSVILIPFDRTEVDNNEEILMGLARIFGVGFVKNYVELKDKVYLMGGSNFTQGDLDILKTTFPSLWDDIQAILSSKGLGEEQAVYMLYNQESNPGRLQGFSKNPFYLGHDLGHSVFDSSDGDWEFKAMLCDFMEKILSLYIREEEVDEESEEELTKASDEITSSDDPEDLTQQHLEDFFNVTSDPSDTFADVFANSADGSIRISIPNNVYLSEDYYLPPEKRAEAESLGAGIIERLKTYMNSHQQYGTEGQGPLSSFTGSVVLQDI